MDEATPETLRRPRTWRWYAGWVLAALLAVGATLAFGVHQADEVEARRQAEATPPPADGEPRVVTIPTRRMAADGTWIVENRTVSVTASDPTTTPDETPEMAASRSLPPEEGVEESTEVVLHYATDRRRIDSIWTLVRREFTLAGLAGLIALLFTLLYKRVVSAPLRPLRWPLYPVVWGVFLFALLSAVQASWISVKRYEDLGVWYGKDPAPSPGAYELGMCTVTIPHQRAVGEVTYPNWWDGDWTPDPSKHFTMSSLTPQPEDAFYASVRERLAAADQDSLLIFVHGYNNRFEHAAYRTAQIVHDLEYPGVAMFWSWPSRGEEEAYTMDEAQAQRSVAALASFLAVVRSRSGASTVHLLAHSMGSRVLTRAVTRLEVDADPQFDLIVLGAPDIDAVAFETDIAPKLKKQAKLVTIYASRNDPALKASAGIHGYNRLGEIGEAPLVIDDVDTIDVSDVCSGHTYIGNNGRVLADLRMLLTSGQSAVARASVNSMLRPLGRAWKLIHLH